MGYTTEFVGGIEINPPLSETEIEFINKFARTRRMKCEQGPYYVDRGGYAGQDHGPDVIDYNKPPDDQPGLWCHWESTPDGEEIGWNGGEKFYNSAEWMQYIIDHFLGNNPIAQSELPFLTGHILNGKIIAQGEDTEDRWILYVKDNKVSVEEITDEPYNFEIICTNCGNIIQG